MEGDARFSPLWRTRSAAGYGVVLSMLWAASALVHAAAPGGMVEGIMLAAVITVAAEIGRRRRTQAAVRTRERFIESAAHELRTPLTALRLQFDSLRRQAARGDAPASELRALLDKSDRQLDRLGRLVHNLVAMSRLDAGELRLDRCTTDLGDVVRTVAARRLPDSRRRGCDLLLDADDGTHGMWDRAKLEQVVDNLLDNALRYGAGRSVEVELRRRTHGAFLRVRDNGDGIAELDPSRVFGWFEGLRGDADEGLGIGLYVARGLIEAHGGSIRVATTPGEGATFEVELPYGSG